MVTYSQPWGHVPLAMVGGGLGYVVNGSVWKTARNVPIASLVNGCDDERQGNMASWHDSPLLYMGDVSKIRSLDCC